MVKYPKNIEDKALFLEPNKEEQEEWMRAVEYVIFRSRHEKFLIVLKHLIFDNIMLNEENKRLRSLIRDLEQRVSELEALTKPLLKERIEELTEESEEP